MQATECTSCAIMQPYFFPYLAYFQLVDAVNTFVIYDDVNYINGGWIHRNNILSHGGSQRIVLNLSGSSQNKLINEIEIFGESKKILKTISQNYSKAPNFEATFSFFENLISKANGNLATYLEYGIREICRTLGIDSKIIDWTSEEMASEKLFTALLIASW